MADVDLAIRNGTVVSAGGRGDCDVGIRDGRVVQLGGELSAREELDADGCFVLPGAIDMHVHLSAAVPGATSGPTFVDDFVSGTRAALAGGVTTLGQMSFPEEDDGSSWAAVERDAQAAAAGACCDFVFHPSTFLPTSETLEEVPRLAAAGHLSLKVVMIAFDHAPRHIVETVRLAGQHGMVTYVHCEDGALVDHATEELVRAGLGDPSHYPQSRPVYTERAAVERAVAMCEATGAPMVLVHLSSAEALEVAHRARRRGLPVYVETRPLYLHLTHSVHAEPDGGRFVGMPPLRSEADRDALWQGLADGSVQTVATDHAPWFLHDKVDPELDVSSIPKGVAELETMLPLLFSEGVLGGRLTLEQLVAVTSTNAAQLNGLYPRKGTLSVGADADVVVLDPTSSWTVDGAAMESRAGYSVYDGREITGAIRWVVSRGDVVCREGTVEASPGRGRLAPRRRSIPL